MINGGIGLQKIDIGVIFEGARARGNDARADGLAESKGIADGDDGIADGDGCGGAEAQHGQMSNVDLEQRDVRDGVGAENFRRDLTRVGQADADHACAHNHVAIGDDQAVGTNDEARAECGGPAIVAAGVAGGSRQESTNQGACIVARVGIGVVGGALTCTDSLLLDHDGDDAGGDLADQRRVA